MTNQRMNVVDLRQIHTDRYFVDGLSLARRLAAQVVIARHYSIDATAIVTSNFDHCGPCGPAHGGPSYIGSLHICPRSLSRMNADTRHRISVAGAVADMQSEDVGLAEFAVHARMSDQDCVLAGIPKIITDHSLVTFLRPVIAEVADLLQEQLADKWGKAARRLIVAPFEWEVMYPSKKRFKTAL